VFKIFKLHIKRGDKKRHPQYKKKGEKNKVDKKNRTPTKGKTKKEKKNKENNQSNYKGPKRMDNCAYDHGRRREINFLKYIFFAKNAL